MLGSLIMLLDIHSNITYYLIIILNYTNIIDFQINLNLAKYITCNIYLKISFIFIRSKLFYYYIRNKN